MFGLRNRRRPRAAARNAAAVRAAVTPVVAECLEQRVLLSTVSVWVESIQSTAEATTQQTPGKFRFHASACTGTNPPASVTVTFELSGTASSSTQCGGSVDYTGDLLSGTVDVPVNGYADVTFDAVDDQEAEGEENVIVTLNDGGNAYAVPAEGVAGRAAAAGIADNDINVWVETPDAEGSENANEPVSFTFFRHGGEGSALAVYYTLGGTATPGVVHPELGGAILPQDADYFAGEPESGGNYFKAVIPAGETGVTVSFSPNNDSFVEQGETIELSVIADQSAGGPFYNPPPVEGAASAEVLIADLQATPPDDPDQPSGAEVASWLDVLENGDGTERFQAETWLYNAYHAHPGIEPQLNEAFEAATPRDNTNETLWRLRNILGPVRLALSGNTIVMSLRYSDPQLPEGTIISIETPGSTGFADFKRSASNNNVIEITPLLDKEFELISVSVTYSDKDGNIINSYVNDNGNTIPLGYQVPFAFGMKEFV